MAEIVTDEQIAAIKAQNERLPVAFQVNHVSTLLDALEQRSAWIAGTPMVSYQSAQDDFENLRARIAQLEAEANRVNSLALEQRERLALTEAARDELTAENQRLQADNAELEKGKGLSVEQASEMQRLRADGERFKSGGDKAIDLIVQLEGIIDRAAGDRSYRGELIDDLRSAIDTARGK
jgi:hypothetical protein